MFTFNKDTDFLWWLLFCVAAVLLVFLFYCEEAHCSIANEIDSAILHVVNHGIPEHNIKPCPANKIAKNSEKRAELVNAIEETSAVYAIDPYLMVALAFRENSFLPDAVGGIGERGVFQMVEKVAQKIKREMEPRCTLDTVKGSAWCTAAWLNHWRNRCGSMEGAFLIYATGKKCRPYNTKTAWLIKDRFGIARRLKNISFRESN